MSDIYSAAQLTIIAVAGENPEYGLPGVSSRARTFKFEYESVGSKYVTALPLLGSVDIYHSKWASRAWTFQEGYLSHRRLFFTDRQTIFVCNLSTRLDNPDEQIELEQSETLRHIADTLPSAPRSLDGMDRAKAHLKSYSKRKLTFDSDALDAISSSFKLLPSHRMMPVHHISGVPYAAVSGCGVPQAVWVALYWQHSSCCRRRLAFPSWSPLGWEGQITWNRQTHPRPIVPNDGEITFHAKNESVKINAMDASGHHIAHVEGLDETQMLEITAYTVKLPFTSRSSPA
jgi:hypothetical protein